MNEFNFYTLIDYVNVHDEPDQFPDIEKIEVFLKEIIFEIVSSNHYSFKIVTRSLLQIDEISKYQQQVCFNQSRKAFQFANFIPRIVAMNIRFNQF